MRTQTPHDSETNPRPDQTGPNSPTEHGHGHGHGHGADGPGADGSAQGPDRSTHVTVQDVTLAGGGTLALITLESGSHRPATIGPQTLAELSAAVAVLRARTDLVAVAVTGQGRTFAAGADLLGVTNVSSHADAVAMSDAGHAAFAAIADLPLPTFALVNGTALGGGLELALHCDHRVAAAGVRSLGLPEVSLGLVPGWGGTYMLPRLIGLPAAAEVICGRGLAGKALTASEALALGLVDAVIEDQDFLTGALTWVDARLGGVPAEAAGSETAPPGPDTASAPGPVATGPVATGPAAPSTAAAPTTDPGPGAPTQPDPRAVLSQVRAAVDGVVHGSRPAPYRAVDLLEQTATATREEAYAAEAQALADLLMSDELRASIYAFRLVSSAKHGVGKDVLAAARPITQVGVMGAGLMAAQIATLVALRSQVPVVMRDVDDARVSAGLAAVRAELDKVAARGKISPVAATQVAALVTGTTQLADVAGCDLVIEAITEDLALKQRVFAELEAIVDPATVLATNTSALSVTAIAGGLKHPERVVGLHFFNPVAAMPLIEVVRTGQTSDEALATALTLCAGAGKTGVPVADRPGFVVNRLLVLLLGLVSAAVADGTPPGVADAALDPLGLPMRPLELLGLVGPGVGLHVLKSLREDLGPRYPSSAGLERIIAASSGAAGGAGAASAGALGMPDASGRSTVPASPPPSSPPLTGPELCDQVLTALTREIGLMLDEGVVPDPSQIDLCMLLGAGWGRHLGGITPYLDRTGYSTRVLGHRFLPDGVANVPASAAAG